MRTLRVLAAMTALAGVALADRPLRAEIIDGVAAVVNGEIIMLSEVEEHCGPGLPAADATGEKKSLRESMIKRAAEDLVTAKLVAKECKEQTLEPTAAEIDNAIEDVQRANKIDRPTLERALKEQGLGMPKYREMLTEQLCRMKVVEMKVKNRVTVTEDDVKHAIVQQTKGLPPPQEMKVRDIYVNIPDDKTDPANATLLRENARAAILQAQARLKKGDDFLTVAKEVPGPIADTGGDLGWMKQEDMLPELQKVSAELPDGGVSGIIPTKLGYHILRIEGRRTLAEPQIKAEQREELRQKLLQEKLAKATDDYLADLRRAAEIDYRLP